MILQEFENHLNTNSVLVTYFSHEECNVCKVLKPQVKKITAKFINAAFLYVNTQQSPEVSGQFVVFTVPTIILFFQGREAKRYSRHISLQDFQTFLDRLSDAG